MGSYFSKNQPVIATEIIDETKKLTPNEIKHISRYLRNDSKIPFKFHQTHFGIDLELEIIHYGKYNFINKNYQRSYNLYCNGNLLREYNWLDNLFDDINNFEKYFVYYENNIITKNK